LTLSTFRRGEGEKRGTKHLLPLCGGGERKKKEGGGNRKKHSRRSMGEDNSIPGNSQPSLKEKRKVEIGVILTS